MTREETAEGQVLKKIGVTTSKFSEGNLSTEKFYSMARACTLIDAVNTKDYDAKDADAAFDKVLTLLTTKPHLFETACNNLAPIVKYGLDALYVFDELLRGHVAHRRQRGEKEEEDKDDALDSVSNTMQNNQAESLSDTSQSATAATSTSATRSSALGVTSLLLGHTITSGLFEYDDDLRYPGGEYDNGN
jgi:hypothetical protein